MAKIEDYKTKVIDTQKERRNFPGFQEKEYWTTEEMQKGETGGMTETDSKTSGKEDGQYSTINKKSGKGQNMGGTVHSSPSDIKYDSNVRVNRR